MTESGLPLFDYVPPAPSSPKQETQQEALERVLSRQQVAVVAFLKAHVGKEFRGEDLRASCEQQLGKVAPDSPRRVMNELVRRNVVAVRVICQSKSLYFCEGA